MEDIMQKRIYKNILIFLVAIVMCGMTIGCTRGKGKNDINSTEGKQINYNYTIKTSDLDHLLGKTFNEKEKAILKALKLTGLDSPERLNSMQETYVTYMEAMWNYLEKKYGQEFRPVEFSPANFDETYDSGYFGSNTPNADTLVTATMTGIKGGYGFDDDYPAIYCKDEYIKEVSEYLNEHYGAGNYKIDVDMGCESSNDVTGKEKPEELIKKDIAYGTSGVILNASTCTQKDLKEYAQEYSKWLYNEKKTTDVVVYFATKDEFQNISASNIKQYFSTTLDTAFDCSISQDLREIDVSDFTRK